MFARALISASLSAPALPSLRHPLAARQARAACVGVLVALLLLVGRPVASWALPDAKKPAAGARPAGGDAKPKEEEAGPSPEARAANQKALDLVKEGNYREALKFFQIAYDESPSFIILYNIGRMSRFTQDFARALKAFTRYLDEGRYDIDAARRSEVEQEIASLTSLVGWATIKTESGARVSVDGQELGTAPLGEKLPVNPGARTFKAEKPSGEISTLDVTMKAGTATEVVLDFGPKETGPKQPVTPKGEPFRFPSGLTVTAWVTTGVLGTATIVTGVLAVATSNDLSNDVYVGPAVSPSTDSDIAKKSRRVDAFSTATNALLAAAIVSGTTAIAFSIVDAVAAGPAPKQAPGEKKPPPKPASLQVRVGVGSLSLTGAF